MLNLNGHIEDYIIYNYEQKRLFKNERNPRFYGWNKIIFLFSAHQPMGKFCHMAMSKSSSRKYIKIQ